MSLLESLLRRVVSPPVQSMARGEPAVAFTQLQCYAYPDLCRTQFEIALRGLDARAKQLQRDVANQFLRDIF
jgi:hypothetical protein